MQQATPIGRFQRVLKLLMRIQAEPRFNAEKLAAQFSVSRRTIFRDITLLRDVGIPVEFDEDIEAYRVDTACLQTELNDRETENLATLILAARMSPTYYREDVSEKVNAAIKKILHAVSEDVRNDVVSRTNKIEDDLCGHLENVPGQADRPRADSKLDATPEVIDRIQFLEVVSTDSDPAMTTIDPGLALASP